MSVSVEFIPGPFTTEMPRTSAERALRQHPAIRKGAAFAMEQLDGRWVAAIVHTAGEPPFGGGGPADAAEEAPAPKSEGPGDSEPSEGGEDKPPKPEGESGGGDSDGGESGESHDKGGKGGELHQIVDMLSQIADALGLPIGLGESPVPGADGPDVPTPPPAGPPHGPGGPPGAGAPGGPPHGPGDVATQHVVHERVTKPGETPPGGTPIGAPAFASVRADHPWAHIVNKVASFEVADQIGEAPLGEVQEELHALASEVGYRVANFRESRNSDNQRVAVAVITKH